MKPVASPRLGVRLVVASLTLLSTADVIAQPTFTSQDTSWFPSNGINLNARSASLADIDNDGDLDLFFQGTDKRLYRNNVVGTGAKTFTDISSGMPLASLGPTWSAGWGDYDGDGFVDVFVGKTNSGLTGTVLRNNGDGSFTDRSAATALLDPGFHQNVGWIDIDNDRDLDLIIGMEGPEKHEIYLQRPGNVFSAVGAAVGFQVDFGTKGYGLAMGDADGDGDIDIYLSTCPSGIRNNFFKNMLVETGSLSFIDIADANGTQFMGSSYGTEFIDFDDDGDLDLYLTGADQWPSKIWRNDGNLMFTDIDTITGHPLLSNTGGDLNGSKAIDYDNDGDLDLFFHDNLGGRGSNSARRLYRNDGNWKFSDVTVAEGLFTTNQGAYDSAWGDIDLDGDLDLIAATASGTTTGGVVNYERVFISNAAENGNHWLYVRLAGPTDNTTGIGAALYATIHEGTPDERTLRRDANTNIGTFNQSDVPVHFGLGTASIIDKLEIRWPDGTVQILLDVPVDKYITINTPGDFNGDGKVNSADLALWIGDFGETADSDANYDGYSDGVDFLVWQAAFGNGVPPSSAAAEVPIPEPSAMTLSAAVACILAASRRRSRA